MKLFTILLLLFLCTNLLIACAGKNGNPTEPVNDYSKEVKEIKDAVRSLKAHSFYLSPDFVTENLRLSSNVTVHNADQFKDMLFQFTAKTTFLLDAPNNDQAIQSFNDLGWNLTGMITKANEYIAMLDQLVIDHKAQVKQNLAQMQFEQEAATDLEELNNAIKEMNQLSGQINLSIGNFASKEIQFHKHTQLNSSDRISHMVQEELKETSLKLYRLEELFILRNEVIDTKIKPILERINNILNEPEYLSLKKAWNAQNSFVLENIKLINETSPIRMNLIDIYINEIEILLNNRDAV